MIAIILSIFLLTYTYIEARSNYHRGSILVLAYFCLLRRDVRLTSSYVVLMMGFYFAPPRGQGDADNAIIVNPSAAEVGWGTALSALWL